MILVWLKSGKIFFKELIFDYNLFFWNPIMKNYQTFYSIIIDYWSLFLLIHLLFIKID